MWFRNVHSNSPETFHLPALKRLLLRPKNVSCLNHKRLLETPLTQQRFPSSPTNIYSWSKNVNAPDPATFTLMALEPFNLGKLLTLTAPGWKRSAIHPNLYLPSLKHCVTQQERGERECWFRNWRALSPPTKDITEEEKRKTNEDKETKGEGERRSELKIRLDLTNFLHTIGLQATWIHLHFILLNVSDKNRVDKVIWCTVMDLGTFKLTGVKCMKAKERKRGK